MSGETPYHLRAQEASRMQNILRSRKVPRIEFKTDIS